MWTTLKLSNSTPWPIPIINDCVNDVVFCFHYFSSLIQNSHLCSMTMTPAAAVAVPPQRRPCRVPGTAPRRTAATRASPLRQSVSSDMLAHPRTCRPSFCHPWCCWALPPTISRQCLHHQADQRDSPRRSRTGRRLHGADCPGSPRECRRRATHPAAPIACTRRPPAAPAPGRSSAGGRRSSPSGPGATRPSRRGP